MILHLFYSSPGPPTTTHFQLHSSAIRSFQLTNSNLIVTGANQHCLKSSFSSLITALVPLFMCRLINWWIYTILQVWTVATFYLSLSLSLLLFSSNQRSLYFQIKFNNRIILIFIGNQQRCFSCKLSKSVPQLCVNMMCLWSQLQKPPRFTGNFVKKEKKKRKTFVHVIV